MTYTRSVRGVHGELPLPQSPSWAGYWTFVVAMVLLMFVLFLAKKGTLSTWIGFLGWSAPTGTTGDKTDTANSTAVGANPTPTAPSFFNFITGNWYQPGQTTSQGTLTPAGSAAAGAQGAGIGKM